MDYSRLGSTSALPRQYPGWMYDMQASYRDGNVTPRRQPG